MASLNRVELIGNLGADPVIRVLNSGEAVANITLATTDTWKDKQTGTPKEYTEWHRVVLYRRLAEIARGKVRRSTLRAGSAPVAGTRTAPRSTPPRSRQPVSRCSDVAPANPALRAQTTYQPMPTFQTIFRSKPTGALHVPIQIKKAGFASVYDA